MRDLAARRQVAAQAHRDRARDDFGQPGGHDEPARRDGARDAGGQRERDRQAVGHPQDEVADRLRPGAVALAVSAGLDHPAIVPEGGDFVTPTFGCEARRTSHGEEARVTTSTTEPTVDIAHLRHTAAHVLAYAVQDLFPDAKPTIGPAIENGFYYDFDRDDAVHARGSRRSSRAACARSSRPTIR